MKPTARTLTAAVALLALPSCASIVGSSDQSVSFRSTPAGATVSVTDENGIDVYRGQTPTSVVLEKADGYFDAQQYTVRFTKPGYRDEVTTVGANISGWYIGNLLFGGIVGLAVVDPLTGAMWTLDPDQINVLLTPEGDTK